MLSEKEGRTLSKIGLVLEGGGMRGVYTTGVLDFFLEKDLYFSYVVGVSAGACNAVSYISGQKGRNLEIYMKFVRDKRYMSFRNLLMTQSLFGMDFIFDEIPNKHIFFDFDHFQKSQSSFIIGTTDCITGEPVYFEKEDIEKKFTVLRASASLPMIAPIVRYKGLELLDGSIADPIPIQKSIEDGNEKHIVVLTRSKGYRKPLESSSTLLKFKYRKYPRLVQTMMNRNEHYNQVLEQIYELEQKGRVLVLQPSAELVVGRYEKDPNKLYKLYQNGYRDAKQKLKQIIDFIS